MTEDLSQLVAARLRDVPDFPQPGVLFKDITPLLADGPAFGAVVRGLADRFDGFDYVAGVEARGFLIAAALAQHAGAGLLPVRKAGKLPPPVLHADYALEYGTARIELPAGRLPAGSRVLLVDDVLATGGTLAAAAGLLRAAGAELTGLAVLIELAFLDGRAALGEDGPGLHAVLTV